MTQNPLPGAGRLKCIAVTGGGGRCTRWSYSDTDRCRQHGKLVKARTPTALSAQDQADLFDALKDGLALDEAVIVAGVSRSTVYDWLAKARQAGTSTEYAAFAAGVERSRTELERRTLRQLSAQAANGNVRAQIFLLERVSSRYSRPAAAGQMKFGTDSKPQPADDDTPDNVVAMRPASGHADW